MMHIPNSFYIRCDKCGIVTLVEADSLDYETSVYDRPMGEEIEYNFRGEICCDECHSWIEFSIRGYEYPVGAFNFSDSECHGGCFIDEPIYKMKSEMILLRRCASSGNSIVAHSVVQELLLHLSNDIGKSSFETDENVKRIIENEEEFFDDILDDVDFEDEDYFNEDPIYNEEWVFDLFGDKDIVTYLYSNFALEADNCYHFDHWFEHQFYAD